MIGWVRGFFGAPVAEEAGTVEEVPVEEGMEEEGMAVVVEEALIE